MKTGFHLFTKEIRYKTLLTSFITINSIAAFEIHFNVGTLFFYFFFVVSNFFSRLWLMKTANQTL